MRRVGATARVDAGRRRGEALERAPGGLRRARSRRRASPDRTRTLGFGELALEAGKLPVPKAAKDVKLRPERRAAHVGTDAAAPRRARVSSPAQAMFGADVRLPGMLIAVIARPPVVGGKVARYDAKRALAMPGVQARRRAAGARSRRTSSSRWGGVAVVADTRGRRCAGAPRSRSTWDAGRNATYDSDELPRGAARRGAQARARSSRNVGDVDAALAKADDA